MQTSPRSRHQSAPQPHQSTACTLHFKERTSKRPAYRPAALRRNGSISVDFSPPTSPSVAATEAKTSWLGSLPWSPSTQDANKELGAAAYVRGKMLSRAQWKPDAEVDECADPDCKQRFDLLNRRHHCRTCGDIFCGSHSSRSTLLWPSNDDEQTPAFTPRGTPRATPRSSSVDLPSLAYSVSPTASYISTATISSSSSTASSSTPTSSPPNPSLMPVSARVCDRCYFSAPTPSGAPCPLLTPSLALPSHVPWAFGAAAASRPLSLRHPRGTSTSRSRSRASSPGHSPPSTLGGASGLSRQASSRSRQGSAASASSSSLASEYSTPSTSVEGLPATASSTLAHKRGLSPTKSLSLRGLGSGASLLSSASAAGVVATPSAVPEEESDGASTETEEVDEPHCPPVYDSDDDDDSDDEARHDATVQERRRMQQEYGSVQGGPWQSWATF